MAMWTNEQKQAIEIRGSNVIVSAGAGSGKTAVLTERAYQILKNREAEIDELLILTFTNAAAQEMKDRIRSKLRDNGFFDVADQVEASNITTFDAYALSIVKQNHMYLNISPNVAILDETIISVERRKIIDAIFMEQYQIKNPAFLDMISNYCPKSDEELKKFVENIIHVADLQSDKYDFLNNLIKNTRNEEKLKMMLVEIISEITSCFDDAHSMFESLMDDNEYAEKAMREIDLAFANAEVYDDFYNAAITFRFPRAKLETENDNNVRDAIKKLINALIKRILPIGNECVIRKNFYNEATVNSIKELIYIAQNTDKQLSDFKKYNNAFGFQDIAKLALQLVCNNDIAEEIKNSIKFIMIDEYQDTSDIQDDFIMRISNNNVFMVGDTKQSIYRFRNANCAIFQGKYDSYKNHRGGFKIDLNKNFRSRSEVIEDLNGLFSALMSNQYGGVDYQKDHIIQHGNKSFDIEGKMSHDCHSEVYYYDMTDVKHSKEEQEAHIIAQDITLKINDNYQVFDGKNKTLRSSTYADFAVLIESKSSFDTFRKVFDKYGIPLRVYKEELIASSQVGIVLNNLIKILIAIDTKTFTEEFKLAFVSVARSYLFSKSDQEIYEVVTNQSIFDTDVYKSIFNIFEQCKEYSLANIVRCLVEGLDMYAKIILLGDVESNTQNIDSLIATTSMLEDLGFTLNDYHKYLMSLEDLKIDLSTSSMIEAGNVVKIMTIHKSKGLEFNITYFPQTYKSISKRESKSLFQISSSYGISMPIIEGEENDNIPLQDVLMKMDNRRENLSERIRLFYVALTRTKEKIIILAQVDDISTDDLEFIPTLRIADSFIDFLSYSQINGPVLKAKRVKNVPNIITKNISNISENEMKALEIRSPQKLFKQKSDANKASKDMVATSNEFLQFGTDLHYLLELVDLKTKDTSFIKDIHQRELINRVLKLDIMQINPKSFIYKEYAFFNKEENLKGVIDLMIENEFEIYLIDYKTKNIDDIEYDSQLKIYRNYIAKVFNKKITLYLLSIKDVTYRLVE